MIIVIVWLSIQLDVFFMPTDYRDSYTGNYVSTEICKRLNTSEGLVYDTSNYTIQVSKNAMDSMLTLMTREGELIVKLVGNNFRHPTGRHCFGKFSGDSIYVTIIPSPGPTSYRYNGKK